VVLGRSEGTTRCIDIYRVRLDIYIHMYIRCGRVGGGGGISRDTRGFGEECGNDSRYRHM